MRAASGTDERTDGRTRTRWLPLPPLPPAPLGVSLGPRLPEKDSRLRRHFEVILVRERAPPGLRLSLPHHCRREESPGGREEEEEKKKKEEEEEAA